MRGVSGGDSRPERSSAEVRADRSFVRGRASVLVVDDEPAICRALERALTSAGFDVRTAASGELAESLLRNGPVDALVLDLRMRGYRGDELFATAVSLQPHLRTATLFMTGDVTPRAAELIAACGCPLVYKPFDLADVVGAVRAFTNWSRDATA